MERVLPGPWTVLLPARWVVLARDLGWPWPLVGLRVPDDARFRSLAEAVGAPLLMSSINPHGADPLHGARLAEWLAQNGVPAAFDPHSVTHAAASAVVAFDPLPRVLRGEVAGSLDRPGQRVLVVCSGNICRSPLAAAILERELASAWGVAPHDLARLGWIVESAGTSAMPGSEASEHSQTAAREVGLDLREHRARQLTQALAGSEPDLLLGMSRGHVEALREARSGAAELFDPSELEVADPFGGSLDDYRRVRAQLQRAAQERVQAWSCWGSAAHPVRNQKGV